MSNLNQNEDTDNIRKITQSAPIFKHGMGEEIKPKGEEKAIKHVNSTKLSSTNVKVQAKHSDIIISESVNNLCLEEDSSTEQEELILTIDLENEPSKSSNEEIKLVLPKLKRKNSSWINVVTPTKESTNLVKELIHRKARYTNLTSGPTNRRNAVVFHSDDMEKNSESSDGSLPLSIPNLNIMKKKRKSKDNTSEADVSSNDTE